MISMSNIIIQTSTLKSYERFHELCEYCRYDTEWIDALWTDVIMDALVYEELVYYLENHALKDAVSIEGYGLTDLYVFQMNKYNLIREIGKNPVECNKERMVLNSFRMFLDMKKHPEEYIKRIEEGKGNDRL